MIGYNKRKLATKNIKKVEKLSLVHAQYIGQKNNKSSKKSPKYISYSYSVSSSTCQSFFHGI
jgi:hypothetical protein